MSEIRTIVQEEIRRYMEAHLEQLVSRTYDQDGNLVATSYCYEIEEGHWVKIKTNKEFDAFSEHIRTDANREMMRKQGFDVGTADLSYDSQHLFKMRGDRRFDSDIVDKTGAGIFVARK